MQPPTLECFCMRNQRLYYRTPATRKSSWQAPASLVLREVLTDMQTHELAVDEALVCMQVLQHASPLLPLHVLDV